MFPIYKYASDALKQKFLPELATGKLIGAFGLTEPNHGSNPGTAVRVPVRVRVCVCALRCGAVRCGVQRCWAALRRAVLRAGPRSGRT